MGNKIAEIQRMYEYFWWHALPGIILNWVIIPVFIAYCAIFLFPKLTDEFLKKQKKNKENEDIILRADLRSEEENAKASTKLLKAQKEELDALKEKLKAENDAEIEKKAALMAQEKINELNKVSKKSEQEVWAEEFEILIWKFPDFCNTLTSLIYEDNGDSTAMDDYRNLKKYHIWDIQLLDVNWLISLEENSSWRYHITEKGRFFLKFQSLN